MKLPVSADTLRRNPLGIYIDGIDWSRELEPTSSTALARTAKTPSNVPLGLPLDPAYHGALMKGTARM